MASDLRQCTCTCRAGAGKLEALARRPPRATGPHRRPRKCPRPDAGRRCGRDEDGVEAAAFSRLPGAGRGPAPCPTTSSPRPRSEAASPSLLTSARAPRAARFAGGAIAPACGRSPGSSGLDPVACGGVWGVIVPVWFRASSSGLAAAREAGLGANWRRWRVERGRGGGGGLAASFHHLPSQHRENDDPLQRRDLENRRPLLDRLVPSADLAVRGRRSAPRQKKTRWTVREVLRPHRRRTSSSQNTPTPTSAEPCGSATTTSPPLHYFFLQVIRCWGALARGGGGVRRRCDPVSNDELRPDLAPRPAPSP